MVEMNAKESATPSYKVVMLGESFVGKTCIVNRYIKGQYITSESTIGSNFSSKFETVVLDKQPTPYKVKL